MATTGLPGAVASAGCGVLTSVAARVLRLSEPAGLTTVVDLPASAEDDCGFRCRSLATGVCVKSCCAESAAVAPGCELDEPMLTALPHFLHEKVRPVMEDLKLHFWPHGQETLMSICLSTLVWRSPSIGLCSGAVGTGEVIVRSWRSDSVVRK